MSTAADVRERTEEGEVLPLMLATACVRDGGEMKPQLVAVYEYKLNISECDHQQIRFGRVSWRCLLLIPFVFLDGFRYGTPRRFHAT